MSRFARRFDTATFARCRDNPGIAALFERWVLPGEPAGSHGLRVAIRDRYLNFYVKGQSVGELRMIGDWPRLKLHKKYHAMLAKADEKAAGIGQPYMRLTADQLAETTGDTLDGWIRTAETYAGDEKRFVDDLVAVTPGTIDLEMALPAHDGTVGADRTAPRMDLVVAQSGDIAFWEAKCAVNGELRAEADYEENSDGAWVKGPHVLWQLRRYQKWFDVPGCAHDVRAAYAETARQLLALAALFGKTGPAIDAWQALVDAADTARVILPPGIVVGNYTPVPANAKAPDVDPNRQKADSFSRHQSKLAAHGATVVCVDAAPSTSILPNLMPGIIRERLN
jgi:phage-related protein